jgi:hypothetical protein
MHLSLVVLAGLGLGCAHAEMRSPSAPTVAPGQFQPAAAPVAPPAPPTEPPIVASEEHDFCPLKCFDRYMVCYFGPDALKPPNVPTVPIPRPACEAGSPEECLCGSPGCVETLGHAQTTTEEDPKEQACRRDKERCDASPFAKWSKCAINPDGTWHTR